MRNVLHPAWLLVANIIPVAILAAIYYGNLIVIESLLSAESISLWICYSSTLAAAWLCSIGYAVYCFVYRKRIHLIYCATVFLVCIPLLYLYAQDIHTLFPWRIPRWMIPEDITVYAGTFLMPAMAHALFASVIIFTRRPHTRKSLYSFLAALAFPVAWFVFFMVILPWWNSSALISSRYSEHVLLVGFIVSSVFFLFVLVRGFYIHSVKRGGWNLFWLKLLVAWILPIVGLTLNLKDKFFGDFSHPAFYILALLNALMLTLRNDDNKRYRVALFVGRSITFTYTLYFFLVFLPYLPLSIVAIIAIGAGFLMLTPLVLMVIHCRDIYEDFRFLKKFYTRRFIYALLIAGIATLPLCVTWVYLRDKHTLNLALKHVYSPDYQQQRMVDTDNLQRALQTVRQNKVRGGGWWAGDNHTPFLTSYYNWLVLDHLTLSQNKISTLEQVFKGIAKDPIPEITSLAQFSMGVRPSTNAQLLDVQTFSHFDRQQQTWRSTVELSMVNPSDMQTEYATTFRLPAGSWIDGYSLWIGDEKSDGLLAEKRTATWVYNEITSTQRDPGILYYLTGNRVALRVFPLEGGQTRKTSFTLLHKEPVQFTLDNRIVALGERGIGETQHVLRAGRAVYIPTQAKQVLTAVKRSPRPYFIIDCSALSKQSHKKLINNINDYFSRNPQVDSQATTFVLANAYTLRVEGWEAAREALIDYNFEGGFFLERAVKQTLVSTLRQPSAEYPYIIVVTSDLQQAVPVNDFGDLQWAFPDSDFFFELGHRATLIPHSLLEQPLEPLEGLLPALPYAVAAWPSAEHVKAYIRLDTGASVVLENLDADNETPALKLHDWNSALALQGAWMQHLVHPERTHKAWLPLVRGSFETQVMTPVTSYVALENEAQRQALLKKQQEVLHANPNFDVGEETRMREPGLWPVLAALIILLLILYRKALQQQLKTSFSLIQQNLQ